MEQTELVLVIFVCWERGGLYMEIVCVECQGGVYAQDGGGGGDGFYVSLLELLFIC